MENHHAGAPVVSSDTLGDRYPYWWRDGEELHWSHWADGFFDELPEERRRLDPAGVLSLLSFQYICGDRTLVDGVQRLPWMGSLHPDGSVRRRQAPPHGLARTEPGRLAERFIELASAELRRHVAGRSTIYILLSGGMDSRVSAALLKALERNGELDGEVRAVTWGLPTCRDVVYASRLAAHLGWEWTHLPHGPEHHWDNFDRAARWLGAEMDPKHLHRMAWFEDAAPDSVVIATSYGDNIGRGEFSGVPLARVEALSVDERSRLLRPTAFARALGPVEDDVRSIRAFYGPRSETGWREIERQAHYMRRRLCVAMDVINRWTELRQMFVDPSVFGLMWAQHPEHRGDHHYVEVLQRLEPGLLQTGWARTGHAFGVERGEADHLDQAFHNYGGWLRRQHADRIGELLFDGTLGELEIFDEAQIGWMYEDWRRERPDDNTTIATQLSSLATISLFASAYDIGPPDWSRWQAPDPRYVVEDAIHKPIARASQWARRVSRPWRVRLGG